MTTLAQMTLRVAQELGDVLHGTAEAGTATTINDTVLLVHNNGYWDKGSLWILSGTHSGKYAVISKFANNTLTFPTFTTSVGTCKYAVARRIYPMRELIRSINTALEDDTAKILDSDNTLSGDGSAKVFTLPAGVSDVDHVELDDGTYTTPSHHWKERQGELLFDYPIPSGDTIVIYYRRTHDTLADYDDAIDNDINLNWLKWKAIEIILLQAIRVYGDNGTAMRAQFLSDARNSLKGLRPTRSLRVSLHTA